MRNGNQTEGGVPPYDFWLHWNVSLRCYMACEYCPGGAELAREPAKAIDIPRLLAMLNRTGMTFKISFTGGGEPFLVPNMTEACLALSKKHYLRFNTNFAEPQVHEFLQRVDPSRVLGVHASCHMAQLRRRRLFDAFVANCLRAKQLGIPLDIVEVGYPPLLEHADEFRAALAGHGLELKFSLFLGELDGKSYPESYSEEELERFGLHREVMPAFSPTDGAGARTICNAGCTAATVDENGDIFPCDMVRVKIGNMYEGILMRRSPMVCPAERCMCPLHLYDPELYQRTIGEPSVLREIRRKFQHARGRLAAGMPRKHRNDDEAR